MFQRFVAIGDSFTEGVGDELPDGRVRGWADFIALGFAEASGERFEYANLAIRGRKLRPLLDEQLKPALALCPDLISINGGGNDIMRPRVSTVSVAEQLRQAVQTVIDAGVHVLLLSGGNPSDHVPGGRLVQRRGDELDGLVRAMFPIEGATYVDNWADSGLRDLRYWAPDKLHLNAFGHARVAGNVLTAFGVPVPAAWKVAETAAEGPGGRSRNTAAYYREYVLPWLGRRLTGRSSGDGRVAKFAEFTRVLPGEAVGDR